MATITFKGQKIQTLGRLPAIGSMAPRFALTSKELEEVDLGKFGTKMKILNIFPSLDTGVCAASVKNFYKYCSEREDVVVLNISMDLPFASSRFCQAEQLNNCHTLSAFRSSFPKDYCVEITDGPLKGLCSRAVIILDSENKVIYTEQVPEITQEPAYQAAIDALKN